MRDELKRAIEFLNAGRQYASFFEGPAKERKERAVAEEFIASLNADSGLGLSNLQLQRPDPPDLTCISARGERVAIEVAEVVCEEAVRRTAHGEEVLRVWRSGELSSSVTALLRRKDEKTFHGGPFEQIFVCLFTDEPMLTLESARAELDGARFGAFKQITGAFFLFSYQASTQSFPVIKLAHHA
ncbi:MAG TPA: hypothetical protein VGL11_12165 [Candidatus Binatia bacterium]